MTAAGRATDAAGPRSLIVTLYGLYARDSGGWLSVAALVRLLAGLGVAEPAVRSSVSRLKRRGLLAAERRDGAAGYALTPAARELLTEGDARIFGRRRARTADGWLLVVFSVPESERERRHVLRSQLARRGFGTVAPGVWVAPGHLAGETAELMARLGLGGYVQLFSAGRLNRASGQEAASVRGWWDFPGLAARYAEFLARYAPIRARWSGQPGIEPAAAFADYLRLVTDWRRLRYADPGLPPELLPAGWNGAAAARLFARLGDRLATPAAAHVRAVTRG